MDEFVPPSSKSSTARLRAPLRMTRWNLILESTSVKRLIRQPLAATCLAAARSRSRSDNALRCHSLRSRRFATPRGRQGVIVLRRGDHRSSAISVKSMIFRRDPICKQMRPRPTRVFDCRMVADNPTPSPVGEGGPLRGSPKRMK